MVIYRTMLCLWEPVWLRARIRALVHALEAKKNIPDSVSKVIELVGSSPESWEKAAANAVVKAAEHLRDLRIAAVADFDMLLNDEGNVEAYRAKVKVSFKYEGAG